MSLIHIDHPNIPNALRKAFAEKVKRIAQDLRIDPNWLMQVFYAESKLNAKAKNIQNGKLVAAGLLQWTKASGEKGAPSSLLSLSPLQQLDKVKNYFAPYTGKMNSYFDVYLVTFFPAAMGKNDEYVFATKNLSAQMIAQQNPAINRMKDGKITMSEFKDYVWNSTPAGVRGLVFKAEQVFETATNEIKKGVRKINNSVQIAQQKSAILLQQVTPSQDATLPIISSIAALAAFFLS